MIERWVMTALATAAMLLAANPGQAAVSTQRLMQVMQRERFVQAQSQQYTLISQASMLYHLCPQEYRADAEKLAFTNRMFDTVSQRYMAAFRDAHKENTGKLPADETVTAIIEAMKNQQTRAKQSLQARVTDQGCRAGDLMRIDQYWMEKRAKLPNDTPAAAPASPATPDSTIKNQES